MKYLLSPLLLLSLLPSQTLSLEASGGGIGKTVSYKISGGKANQKFILATSLYRASTPLIFLDDIETRSFGIGFDLTLAWIFGALDAAGTRSFGFTLPNDPGLIGAAILHQAVTYPGTGGYALDGISEVVVVPMGNTGVFAAQTSKMSTPRQFASNIPLPDGRVMIVAGATNRLLWQTALKTTDIFDPATHSFTRGPDLIQARATHTQTLLDDGRYLLAGGVNEKNIAVATCEVYDPKTGKFTAVGSLAYKRTYHGAVKMKDGRVVVIGGFEDMGAILGAQQALESGRVQTEIFDPKTNLWSAGRSLRTGRGAPGVQDIGNGKILIIGGVYKTPSSGPDLSLTCEIYDMTTGWITSARSVPVRTAWTTTYQLPGNKILMAGGNAGPSGSIRNYTNFATKSCYIYDANTNLWSRAGALPVATAGGRALTLRDGTLVIAGGGDNTLYFPHGNKGLYSFNPTTRTWSTLGLLVEGRQSPEAFELQAGGIAVVGGGAYKNRADSVDTWELMVR